MRHLLAGCLVVGALAACDPGSQALFLTANVMSYVQADKTRVDHGISYASGEDCSTLTWAEGQGYCRREDASEDLAMEPAAAGPFCYRSIGSIVCYSEPDPNADADLLVTPPTPPSF